MLGELPDHKVMFMKFLAECGDEAGARTQDSGHSLMLWNDFRVIPVFLLRAGVLIYPRMR